MNITVIEYDDPEWAEIGFVGDYQNYDLMNDCSNFINDDVANGYCFINDSYGNFWSFRASYYLNDCVMIYQFFNTSGTPEDYQIYLDICEELGLPTCDEVTEEILGSVG